jgi:hypothetical protein
VIRTLGAIPLTSSNLELEATEAMTRVQERERVMIVIVAGLFGALLATVLGRR